MIPATNWTTTKLTDYVKIHPGKYTDAPVSIPTITKIASEKTPDRVALAQWRDGKVNRKGIIVNRAKYSYIAKSIVIRKS